MAQNDATPCYPTTVAEFEQGLTTSNQPVPADRSDPTTALGEPDASNAVGGFVSLGVNGSITLEFPGLVYNMPGLDLLVFETSFSGDNCGGNDDEYAHIELSHDGLVWEDAGIICRDGSFDLEDYGLAFILQIRITSVAPTSTPDGYDVDGVVAVNGCGPFLVEEGCYGQEVLLYNPGPKSDGNPITEVQRLDPTKALGAPELDDTYNFVSLGYGGELIIGFDGAGAINGPGDDFLIAETTFNAYTFAEYPESSDVLISPNGVDWYLVGEAKTNELTYFDFDVTFHEAGVIFDYIVAVKILDTTPLGSVSEDAYDVDGVVALHGCGPDLVIEIPCEGTWRTQSMGGWGQPGNGNNTGAYRNANFASNFPNGLVVGCAGGFTHTLTTAAAVQTFLPSGGPSTVFNMNRTNHTKKLGAFAGNLTALALTVGSDNEDEDFNTSSDFLLQDLIVQNGLFQGWTVGAVLAEANDVIGGCSTDYTPQQLNTILDNINNAYNGGNDNNNGLLGCPDAGPAQAGIAPTNPESTTLRLPDLTVTPNPNAGTAVISFEAVVNERVTLEVVDMSGRTVATLYNQELNPGQLYRFDFDGQYLPNGIYIAKLSGSHYVITEKVMIAR